GGCDEQGALQVVTLFETADRLRVRRVENVEAGGAKRLPEDLGREARAAHPEEDERGELRARRLSELAQLRRPLAHPPRLVEPAEPARLVAPGPDGRVTLPDPLEQLGGLDQAATTCPSFSRMPSSSSSKESANFCTPSSSSVAVTSS